MVRGEQQLSIDIAMKLSGMIGTSVNYWLNLQNTYEQKRYGDPGIVLGRLQNDKKVDFNDWTMKPLRHKYKVKIVI